MGAVALLAVLMASSFSVFDAGTHRSFLVPKLLATYATAVAALVVLLVRKELRWPTVRACVWTGAALAAMALLGLNAPAPDHTWDSLPPRSIATCSTAGLLLVRLERVYE